MDKMFDFVEDFFSSNKINRSYMFPVNLAIEEIFTNMVKYQPGSNNDISLRLEKDSERLIICLSDFDVDQFDVTAFPEADVEASLEDRHDGGLGLHLVRKMMDSVDYEYHDRTSKVIMIKAMESQNV
jgi:anti-sigma regulatory factor (Ser/Thr protein kinase)